jgi:hypothetical protein
MSDILPMPLNMLLIVLPAGKIEKGRPLVNRRMTYRKIDMTIQ